MGCHDRSTGIVGKENHFAVAQAGHVGNQGIVGIEHCDAIGQNYVDLGALDLGRHLLGIVNVIFWQSIGWIDIGDDTDLTAVVGKSLGENRDTTVFKYRGLYGAVEQHATGGSPVGAVAFFNLPLTKVQAVATSQADMLAAEMDDACDQSCDGGFAMGAGDADDWNPAGVLWLEQMIDNCFADRTRFAFRGFEVHQQAWAGIDFNNCSALLLEWLRNIFCHQVDAGNIQANHPCCQRRDGGNTRVNLIGDIDGDIAIAQQQNFLAAGRDRGFGQTLALQLQTGSRVTFQNDRIQ